jgi:beta-N-acetylhexosaminidase
VIAGCAPAAHTATPTGGTGRTPAGVPWADSVLATLTLREKAAQMVWPWLLGDYTPEGSAAWERTTAYLSRDQVGGVIISVGSPTDIAAKLNAMQRASRLPLLVSADFESGAGFRAHGGMFVPNAIDLGGATRFPADMALGASRDSGLAAAVGRITAVEGRALGVHVAFAPVMDVNNNPGNPVIGSRSFGEDPQLVARLGGAFIRGMQDAGMVATAKHFPGHGDTEINSHLGLPTLGVSRARMDSLELVPFRAAIGAGVGGVMTFHGAFTALDSGVPATLSRRVMHDLLREELGFRGLLVTDAMDMQGVMATMGLAEATRRAVEAGNDVLLMPTDIPLTIASIVAGVREGRYSEARVDSSALRILRLKERMGLHRARTVPLDSVRTVVGTPAHLATARQVAERGITLVRDAQQLVPLMRDGAPPPRVLSVIVSRRADLAAGREFNAELRGRLPGVRELWVDGADPEADYSRANRAADSADVVVVSAYALAGFDVNRSNTAPAPFAAFIRALAERGRRFVVVAFDTPYLLRDIPQAPGYLVAWGSSGASQRAAAAALLGTAPITGRLPITIPGVAPFGAGLMREATIAPR